VKYSINVNTDSSAEAQVTISLPDLCCGTSYDVTMVPAETIDGNNEVRPKSEASQKCTTSAPLDENLQLTTGASNENVRTRQKRGVNRC